MAGLRVAVPPIYTALTFTHLVELSRIEDHARRAFYDSDIFVTRYQLELPTEEQLKQWLP